MRPNAIRTCSPESGVALASAILFAVVVLLVGHGILVLTRTQRWMTSIDGPRWARDEERRAALFAASTALDSLPDTGPLETPWGVVQVASPSPEVRVLSVDPAPGEAGMGWATLLSAPDPYARVVDRVSAVRVAGLSFDLGSAVGHGVPESGCLPPARAWEGARLEPFPDDGVGPRLGVLGFDDLLAALPALDGPRLELPEEAAPACQDARGFGDPDRPSSCAGSWGAGARDGDLRLSGRGQGVLAVSGNLTIESDARFRGWVWVGGSVRIAPGAEFLGLADVGERWVVDPEGSFQPDACAGVKALEATPALRRPRRVGPRAWPRFRP